MASSGHYQTCMFLFFFKCVMLWSDGTGAKVSLMADLKAAVEFGEMKKLEASGAKDQVGDVG